MKVKTKTLGLFFLLGYVSFIPSGPFPIYIAGGLKLDILFAALLLSFLLFFYAERILNWPRVLLVAIIFYVATILVSTILSENIQLSSKYAGVMIGYMLITLLVPMVFVDKADVIRRWMFFVAGVIGIIIIVLYTIFSFAHSHRFALAMVDVSSAGHGSQEGVVAVDSNMTAAGLMLSILVYLPSAFKNKTYILPEVFGLGCIAGGALITLSRSASIGLVIAVLVASFIVLFKRFMVHAFFVKKTTMYFCLYGVLWIFIMSVAAFYLMPSVIDAVVTRVALASEDTGRLELFKEAWDIFFNTPKSILIGNGFMTTNPHNEFMRTLSAMGLFGIVATSLFLLVLWGCTFKKMLAYDNKFFSGVAITVFILIITLFYGYTKLIWVAWMYLLLLYQESILIERRLL